MAAKYSSFAGWEKNLKLFNDSVEIIITLEVGPRIISYRPLKGRSVFKLVDEEAGRSNEEGWRIRGGHRLWVAPEDFGKKDGLTYAPDNSQVEHAIDDEFTVRVSRVIGNPSKIRLDMVVTLERTGPRVTVEHRITNQGGESLDIAAWAVTVMAPGGYTVIPQPPPGTHPQDYVPNRAIIAWPFTDLTDERLRIGRRLMWLRHQADRPPIKFGLRHTEGWVAYVLDDHLFMKSVPFIAGETYVDLGSNFEAFTNSELLELETFGPLKRISSGETIVHKESWIVFSNFLGADSQEEEKILHAMQQYKTQLL
jgi:hypothetical protein